MKLYRSILVFFLVFCISAGAIFASQAEKKAAATAARELANIFANKSRYVSNSSKSSDFGIDFKKILKKAKFELQPKTVLFANKPAKILIAGKIDEKTVGVFFQISADGSHLISYLPWYKNGRPLFTCSLSKWNSAKSANDISELVELIPVKPGYSAGVPVERSDVKNLYLIDYIDSIPSKTQEEHKEYTDKVGMKSTLGRRTASSKCLSYSASNASDWWKIAQGFKLGKHTSFVNGSVEYGMNPRAVESLYFKVPASPYTFKKVAGKDRVTGEKIPYSPKHYAYVMANLKCPSSVGDHIKSNQSYSFDKLAFAMDIPFYTVFDHSKGDIKTITSALEKYGILYSQHTSRLFSDKVSLKFQGVHSVNIVGTGNVNGKQTALYYETFGKNHRDYQEDSFYGPRLRAFPVGFFYQAIAFPHKIRIQAKIGKSSALISFRNKYGKSIKPDQVSLKVNGKSIKVRKGSGLVKLQLNAGVNKVELKFSKKYYYTPEEPDGYKRVFFVHKGKIIELNEYAQVIKGIGKLKMGFIKKLLKKRRSYLDYLMKRANVLQSRIENEFKSVRADSALVKSISKYMSSNSILQKSDLGRQIKAISQFKE